MPFILKIIVTMFGLLLSLGGLVDAKGKNTETLVSFMCYVICHSAIILGMIFLPWII